MIGLLIPELMGLPPGDNGDMLMGEVWLIGDMSALIGVHEPVGSMLDVLELPPKQRRYYLLEEYFNSRVKAYNRSDGKLAQK